jgi:hypothetical protein
MRIYKTVSLGDSLNRDPSLLALGAIPLSSRALTYLLFSAINRSVMVVGSGPVGLLMHGNPTGPAYFAPQTGLARV